MPLRVVTASTGIVTTVFYDDQLLIHRSLLYPGANFRTEAEWDENFSKM